MMTENEIAQQIVDAAFKIHTTIGPGLLESAYQIMMTRELNLRGLKVDCEVPVPVVYEGAVIETAFRADMIVEDKVIVELKSVEKLAAIHKKQLYTYLKMLDKRLGMLVNLGGELLKDNVCRVANKLEEPNGNRGKAQMPARSYPQRNSKIQRKS
jgi:GxxExxY protein